MTLQFCPVCRGLLQLKEENGKTIGFCSCGFKRYSGIELTSIDKVENKIAFKGEGVCSNEDFSFGEKHECKKCGCDSADMMDLGERLTNESNVYIYRCKKCGNITRSSNNR